MGNSNSASGGSASSGGTPAAGAGGAAAGGPAAQQRPRRSSISEEQPLVVSSSHGAQTLVDDQYQFSQSLIKSAGLHAPGNGSPAEDVIYARYRAGSVSEPPRFQVKDNQLPTVIKWDKGGKEVFVSGSFNGWKKIQLVKSTNNFYTIVNLNEGEHEYKFLVDGQWLHNPDEPFRSNTLGTVNNVVTVKKSDFEIFQALDKDIAAVQAKSAEIVSGSPPGSYTQDVPVRKPLDRHTGPPILPPQLLQVILNKDIPEHLEPSLLPEPNHVMLNHLYALSIKDGVMVLSSTSRYKKKYVTTLLYKPIDS